MHSTTTIFGANTLQLTGAQAFCLAMEQTCINNTIGALSLGEVVVYGKLYNRLTLRPKFVLGDAVGEDLVSAAHSSQCRCRPQA